MRGHSLIAAVLLIACSRTPSAPATRAPESAAMDHEMSAHASVELTPAARQELAELRAATARFRDTSVAKAAGYETSLTECMTDAARGGMGFHYGDLTRFDAQVRHDAPEILVYEPQKDGSLRFVAVEFAIPFGQWTSEDAPVLFGQPFHRNFRFGLWVLHAWVGRDNPAGIFMDYNPKVTCPAA
jgi:hypothetical protein